MRTAAWRTGLAAVAAAAAFSASVPAQRNTAIDSRLYGALRWRNVGPHRASRTRAAAGHRSHPYTFYMAAVNGGVWKTTDAGTTWVYEHYLKSPNPGVDDLFGLAITGTHDGSTLAISAISEDSNTTGIQPPKNDLGSNVGAIYLY